MDYMLNQGRGLLYHIYAMKEGIALCLSGRVSCNEVWSGQVK